MMRSTPARLAVIGMALTLSLGCAAATAQEADEPTEAPSVPAPPAEVAEPDPPGTPDATDAPASDEPEPNAEVEAVLDQIEAAAGELETLKARLRYDRIQGLLGDEQRRFGEFRYAAGSPAKFDAHFNKLMVDGKARRIDLRYTFDGVWLGERNGQDKTFVRRQLVPEDEAGRPMELGQSPFVLPLDARKADILARFNVALAEPADTDPDGSIHLILTPRDGQRLAQTRIDLWYDAKTMLPMRISSIDDSENQSVIDLMKVQTNKKLDEDTFDTTPPRGGGWSVQIEPLESGEPAEDREP